MSDELFNVVNGILKQNQGFVTNAEPEIGNPDDIIVKCFREEQKSRASFQPWLILGLIVFLIIQLLYTNHLYDESIMKLLEKNTVDFNLSSQFFELYNNILEQLKFYTTSVLCEFIAFFCFIIRWGFNSTVSDLFSNLFTKKSNGKKNKKERK